MNFYKNKKHDSTDSFERAEDQQSSFINDSRANKDNLQMQMYNYSEDKNAYGQNVNQT